MCEPNWEILGFLGVLDIRYRGRYHLGMPKIRRGGYVFLTWAGDHAPRHVHVYRGGRLVLKWDLENQKPMAGRPTRRVLLIIRQLDEEGLL